MQTPCCRKGYGFKTDGRSGEGAGNQRASIFCWGRIAANDVTLAGPQAMSEAVHLHYPLILSGEDDCGSLCLMRVGNGWLACLRGPGV